MSKITYGGEYEIDLGNVPAIGPVPAVSVLAMLQQSFNHRMGNQVAASVVSKVDGLEGEELAQAKVQLTRELRDETIAKILNGTLGVHAGRGASVNPVDREFNKLVEAKARAIVKQNGFKWPKTDDEPINFMGGAKARTRVQLMEQVAKGKDAENMLREAERRVKAAARLTATERLGMADSFDPDSIE